MSKRLLGGRHFSWKKEVMFYFMAHKLMSEDWNLFLRYEISKFKCILNLAQCSSPSDSNDVTI